MPSQPASKIHFIVEWGGTNISFSEITGLDMEYEV